MDWVSEQTGSAQEIWDACERGDWMLWYAGHASDRRLVVRAACLCAREALIYIPAGEDRPRIAIETAERWTLGEATIDEVRASKADAFNATYKTTWHAVTERFAVEAAYAAVEAAESVEAAEITDSSDAAFATKCLAANAASAASYAADAAYAAYSGNCYDSLKRYAVLVRTLIPEVPQ